jgi:hypothetical protein
MPWIMDFPPGNRIGRDEGERVRKRRGCLCAFVLGREMGRLSCGAGSGGFVVRALEGGAVWYLWALMGSEDFM